MPKKNYPTKEPEEVKAAQDNVRNAMIKVVAQWKSFSPDCRPYKPSTPQLEFAEPLKIVVDVPLINELIKNAGVISAAQLTNQSEPIPQFTPLGMRYIIDQFESAMKNGEPEQEETAKADEWEDDIHETKTEPKPADDEKTWEDEDTSKSSEEDKSWDENWEE